MALRVVPAHHFAIHKAQTPLLDAPRDFRRKAALIPAVTAVHQHILQKFLGAGHRRVFPQMTQQHVHLSGQGKAAQFLVASGIGNKNLGAGAAATVRPTPCGSRLASTLV